jgi:exodeoxyribonuclease VII small subunit
VETEKITFEVAFKKLEGIIKKLEEGKLSLDESLKIFEEGTSLAHFCENSLHEANGQIEKLMTNQEGMRKKVPFSVDE